MTQMINNLRKTLFAFFVICLIVSFALANPALAWEDHTTLTRLAFKDSGLDAEMVTIVTLEDFIAENEADLALFFAELEEYLQQQVENYPALPPELTFTPGGAGSLTERFFHAIRINPEYKLNYYIKAAPGVTMADRNQIKFSDMSIVLFNYRYATFYEYAPGEEISALNVLATASDEPDYGFDIGLFEDSDNDFGPLYGFGEQPFGNPQLSYSSQAAFHMGFYNEAFLVYLAAPAMQRCFPEMRALMFAELSRFAFEKGTPYWGYRFAGWGLHYVQDLNMPYHASIMPGSSAAYLLWVGLLDLVGITEPYNKVLDDVSNKHMMMEVLQLELITGLAEAGDFEHILAIALAGSRENETPFNESLLRGAISKTAKDRGKAVNSALEKLIKDHDIFNELHVYYEKDNFDPYDFSYGPGSEELGRFEEVLADSMEATGIYSRSFINWIID